MSIREAFDDFATLLAKRRASTRESVRALEDARSISDGDATDKGRLLEQASALVQVVLRDLDVAEEEMVVQNEALFDAQVEMAEAGARFKRMFDLAPACFLVSDPLGKILDANEASAALFNRDRNYLIGKPIAAFIDPDDRRAFRTALERTRASTSVEEWPVAILLTRHHAVEVLVAVRAVRDHHGKVESLYWILRDESARRSDDLL
ncbi:MAG: PAS domain-containing protein [Gemmatimonadaceae bacterium]